MTDDLANQLSSKITLLEERVSSLERLCSYYHMAEYNPLLHLSFSPSVPIKELLLALIRKLGYKVNYSTQLPFFTIDREEDGE